MQMYDTGAAMTSRFNIYSWCPSYIHESSHGSLMLDGLPRHRLCDNMSIVRMPLIICQVGMAIAQVNQFKHAWMKYAYTYTKEYRTICAGQLVSLLRELPPPLGVGTEGSYYDCKILAKKVRLSVTRQTFDCRATRTVDQGT